MPFLSDASSVASIIGAFAIPITIYQYTKEQRKKRQAEEQAELDDKKKKVVEIFNMLSIEWREFLELCVRYPEINLNNGSPVGSSASPRTQLRITALYEIMVSICESAFQYYRFDPNEQKVKYWKGWEKFLKDWLQTPAFKKHCEANITGEYYSEEFTKYLSTII